MRPSIPLELARALPLPAAAALCITLPALVVLDALGGGGLGAAGKVLSWLGLKSVLAALLAGVLAATLGLFPAILPARPAIARKALLALWLAGAALPPVFLGGVVSHWLGLGPAPPPGAGEGLVRWLALACCWGLSLAPLATLVVLASSRVPTAEWNAARQMLAPVKRFQVVLWPRLRPGLAVSALAAAILAWMDAATPAHFGVDTVASAASFHFMTTLDSGAAGAMLLPAWLLAALIVWLLPRLRERVEAVRAPRAGALAWLPSLAAVAAGSALPLCWLGARAGEGFMNRHGGELVNSLDYAARGAAVCALATVAMAVWLALQRVPGRPRGRGVLAASFALVLFAPGLALGFAAVAANARLPAPELWWNLSLLLRCGAFALPLWLWLDLPAARAGAALGVRPALNARVALRAHGPRLAFAGALAGAAAALREVDLFTAFALPAQESLAARSAQMLHFGMGADVAELLLLQLLLALCWSVPAAALLPGENA